MYSFNLKESMKFTSENDLEAGYLKSILLEYLFIYSVYRNSLNISYISLREKFSW